MAQVAYCCLFEFNMKPSEFEQLDRNEKAFIIAAVQVRNDNEKKRQKELERKRRKK